jgi:hypothetical protein
MKQLSIWRLIPLHGLSLYDQIVESSFIRASFFISIHSMMIVLMNCCVFGRIIGLPGCEISKQGNSPPDIFSLWNRLISRISKRSIRLSSGTARTRPISTPSSAGPWRLRRNTSTRNMRTATGSSSRWGSPRGVCGCSGILRGKGVCEGETGVI